MAKIALILLTWISLLPIAASARAAALLSFGLDPGSTFTPPGGPAQALSGSFTAQLGDPAPASNTSFDVVALDLLASGGTSITLDPDVASPGLGVLGPSGSFLVPLLFVVVGDGTPFDLTVLDVVGTLQLPAGPGSALSSTIEIESDLGSFELALSATAVPEPSSIALVLGGLGLLAVRRGRASR
jgi:hypothetical protein